ncbi:MAG TPA: LysR substrate-binding domain-containing protein [Chthoniobacter sp.]|jgi:DNA-binding transcriptional LysR family regulator
MELRHLRYFVAVAEAENVSRAALKLHVSQPAVSTQIRDLEDEIGFSLLERTAKSVRLTEAGRVFLEEARSVLRHADDAVQRARAVSKGGQVELHVGYSPTPTARILPAILREWQRSSPHVSIKLHDLSNDENLAALADGRLQLAFVIPPVKASALRGLRFEELTREEARLAVSLQHPFARRRAVHMEKAAREPFIAYNRDEYPGYHEYLRGMFGLVKVKPRIIEEHDGFASLLPAIEAGTGVAVVSESFARMAGGRIKLLRLIPDPPPTVLGIAATKGRMSAAAEAFWKCARRAVDLGQPALRPRPRRGNRDS